ncbi:MAG: FtsH protease activity modulator HflK [Clostridia bacterium]
MNEKIKINVSKFKGRNLKIWIIAVLAVILAAYLVFSGIYTVNDKQEAVITTFGRVTSIKNAGMHFKIPFGVQKAYLVGVNEVKTIEIGYRSDGSTDQTVDDESKMITGDFNIVNVDFFVEYKIADPKKYLFASSDPAEILKMLIQSQIRNVIGSYRIDPILTDSKEQIQSDILKLSVHELEKYDIGLQIIGIRIQDSQPPTDEVNQAFMAVKNADSGAKTALNNANAYKNTKEAEADSKVNKTLENASYLKQKRINQAAQEVAMFNAMFDEYIKNPAITKTRMYYEAIEKIFPDVTIYIDTSTNGDIVKLLPLKDLLGGGTK